MPRFIAAVFGMVALALSGHAAAEGAATDNPWVFTDDQFAWSTVDGKNSVEADGVLRTVGGEVKTCAGLDAHIVPATNYTRGLMTRIFGNVDGGMARPNQLDVDTAADPRLSRYWKHSVCNAQGHFAFSHLPDGDYYVLTVVTWDVPALYSTEGGLLMQKVHVEGGDTASVVLTGKTIPFLAAH